VAISPPTTFSLEHVLHAEHARLVRLCAYLSGDRDAADDLAQETLIEAWRQQHKLVDPDGAGAWLNAIARNVCLRWARSHGRELARTAPFDGEAHNTSDAFDLDVELERDELATLLDRALALLPPDTRDVLVQTYIHESPHAEIAERLGLSTNAVGVRVHRGKLLLRRILVNEFRDDAAAYGLIEPQSGGWQQTRIWCPRCGQQRMLGRFDHEVDHLALRCPGCMPHGAYNCINEGMSNLFSGVKSYRPAFMRALRWTNAQVRQALQGKVQCGFCNHPLRVLHLSPNDFPMSFQPTYGITLVCGQCKRTITTSSLTALIEHPPVQHFMRQHSRIRTLPERQLDVDGRAALLTRMEDVTGSAHLDLIFARDTFELLAVHGGRDD